MRRIAKEVRSIYRQIVASSSLEDPDILPFPTSRDPWEALYETGRFAQPVFMCNPDLCVNRKGFSPSAGGWHPYAALLQEYAAGEATSYEGSVLERYYDTINGSLSREYFHKNLPDIPGREGIPDGGMLAPWDNRDAAKVRSRLREVKRREHAAVGFAENNSHISHCDREEIHGPAEFKRLITLYHSIRELGYKRRKGRDGDITGIVLRRCHHYRILVLSGHHRLCTLAALGFDAAPVLLPRSVVIQTEDADWWPQVRRGAWKKESALKYFSFLFESTGVEWARCTGLSDVSAHPADSQDYSQIGPVGPRSHR